MSTLKPDIFIPKEKEDFYMYQRDTTIKPEIPVEEAKMSLEEFKKHIIEYVKNYSDEDKRLHDLAFISAKTTTDNRHSLHYWNILETFFIASLKKTYPDKDLSELENSLKDMKIILEKILKDDNVDNTLFIPCILGIYRGLI